LGVGQQPTDRLVRLDASTVLRRAASPVIALAARAIGSEIALHAERPGGDSVDREGSVSVVDIRGPLMQRGSDSLCMMGWADGYDLVAERVEAALSDRNSSAVVLRIDSPGGDIAGLEQCVERLVAARVASGKRVLAFADEMICSAAYWLAAALCDGGIYLPPAASVGSIGVIAMYTDDRGVEAKHGSVVTVIREPSGKAETHPLAPVEPLATERVTALVRESAERFYQAMASARGKTPQHFAGLNGADLLGQAAVAAGLANGIASWDQVLAMAQRPSPKATTMKKTNQTIGASTTKAQGEPVEPGPPVRLVTCPECGAEFPIANDGPPAEDKPPEDEQPPAAMVELLRLTGQASGPEALATVKAWQESHAKAIEDNAKLAAQVAEKETAERAGLVAELVTLGYETPPTAWEGDAEKRQPKEPWASMTMPALRAYVAVKRENPRAFAGAKPVPSGANGSLMEKAKARGIDPEKVAEVRARFRTVRGGN
jgi:ClpP class serine protease